MNTNYLNNQSRIAILANNSAQLKDLAVLISNCMEESCDYQDMLTIKDVKDFDFFNALVISKDLKDSKIANELIAKHKDTKIVFVDSQNQDDFELFDLIKMIDDNTHKLNGTSWDDPQFGN